jgi:hypothetical protein
MTAVQEGNRAGRPTPSQTDTHLKYNEDLLIKGDQGNEPDVVAATIPLRAGADTNGFLNTDR